MEAPARACEGRRGLENQGPAEMAFKLLNSAQRRWRRLESAHLSPLVRAWVKIVVGFREEQANGITKSSDTQSSDAPLIMIGRSTTFDNCSPL